MVGVIIEGFHDLLTEITGVRESIDLTFRNSIEVLACQDSSRQGTPGDKAKFIRFQKLPELDLNLFSVEHIVLDLSGYGFVQI